MSKKSKAIISSTVAVILLSVVIGLTTVLILRGKKNVKVSKCKKDIIDHTSSRSLIVELPVLFAVDSNISEDYLSVFDETVLLKKAIRHAWDNNRFILELKNTDEKLIDLIVDIKTNGVTEEKKKRLNEIIDYRVHIKQAYVNLDTSPVIYNYSESSLDSGSLRDSQASCDSLCDITEGVKFNKKIVEYIEKDIPIEMDEGYANVLLFEQSVHFIAKFGIFAKTHFFHIQDLTNKKIKTAEDHKEIQEWKKYVPIYTKYLRLYYFTNFEKKLGYMISSSANNHEAKKVSRKFKPFISESLKSNKSAYSDEPNEVLKKLKQRRAEQDTVAPIWIKIMNSLSHNNDFRADSSEVEFVSKHCVKPLKEVETSDSKEENSNESN